MAKKDVLKGRSIVNKNVFDTANKSIDEIKRANPIVEYFKSKGVNLKSTSNGQLMGLCPFHDDKNPSLSVSEDKQVFKCFGCGKSGTVIDAVSYFENVSIGEAIKILQNKKVKTKEIEFPKIENPAEDLKLDLSDLENTPEQPDFDLSKITEYYHKKLYENQPALNYLTKRGLKNPEIYQRFKIGFADGSLLNVIGENQKKELIKSGIISDKGFEVFHNCLIFPIFDDSDNTVGIYARNTSDSAKIKHLYLKGKHRGIFNRKASKVYDEIILTESIIDALSLIEIGFSNVQSVYGINGFTDEHLRTLKDDRVKTVVIAFDKDEAGIKASEDLKDKLTDEGFKVKIITPPSFKDWNDELVNGISKDSIKRLIDNSKTFEQEKDKNDAVSFTVKKDNFGYIFNVSDIIYNVSGVKESFVNTLKVTIKAEYQGDWFPDNVDLCSSRSRDSLSLKLSQRFNVEPKRIEKDLLMIYDHLEKEQKEKLTAGDEKKIELSEEEIKLGTDFLKRADLFEQVIKDMEILGYVGEETNKLLIWFAGISRLLPKPLSVFIQSPPSTGKSYLLEILQKILPSEAVEWITSVSDQAFNYMPEEDFIGKIFMMGEALHNEIIEGYIRQMQSENRLSRRVVIKDPKTGELKAVTVKHVAKLVFMMTSTSMKINLENLSRCMVLKVDDSKEQTERVLAMQRYKSSYEGYLESKHLIPKIIKKHLSAQRLLSKIKIFNPFEKYIKFPAVRSIMRRGQQQFLGIMDCSCVSRQIQKKPIEMTDPYTGEKEIIYECDLTDYETARRLFIEGGLLQHDNDLSSSVIILYEAIRKMIHKKAKKDNLKPEEVSFIQSDVREITELSAIAVRKYIQILVEYEYLQIIGGKRHGTRFCYKIREDRPINEIDISSIIPTVEEIKKLMKVDTTG